MAKELPYNPLDKKNLGVSVADAMLAKHVSPLPPNKIFNGAGVYAIYYVGNYSPYKPLSVRNKNEQFRAPIYVGKAAPPGARKGGLGSNKPIGNVLYKRLGEHADSIGNTKNLKIEDFFSRYLIVDDIWIPLGESLLIERFSPLWNKKIDGFGNHDPGKGRYKQQRSPWDTLHPGRHWAKRLLPNSRSEKEFLGEIKEFLQETQK